VSIFGQVFVAGVLYEANDRTTADPLEVLELKGTATVTKVACADHHILALADNGAVFAWGRGYASGMEGPSHTPHQVPFADGVKVSSFAFASAHPTSNVLYCQRQLAFAFV